MRTQREGRVDTYARVYFPAFARRATARERSWGHQRTLGAREHLPPESGLGGAKGR